VGTRPGGPGAAALVGSWARGDAHPDSDVDIVLLTDSPATYVDHADWTTALGAVAVVRTRQWGLTERRAALAGGLEVDFGVVSVVWASTEPVDAGTRRVVADGLVALYDPDGLLSALVAAVTSR
jgi:nucleotidyltransferase-like protein